MTPFPVRAPVDRYEVLDLVDPDDPAGSVIAGAMAETLLDGRRRAWIVGRPGAEVGIAVAMQLAPGQWSASVLCHDPAAAPVLADLLEASPARRVSGAARHVDPVAAGWADRGYRTARMALRVGRTDVPRPTEVDPRARLAAPGDVAELVAFYAGSDQETLSGSALDEAVRHLVARRRVLVSVVDGEVVGAMRCELRSSRFEWWSGYWVAPAHRSTGVARGLEAEAIRISLALGRGMLGAVAPSNNMRPRTEVYVEDDWVETGVPPAPPSNRERAVRKTRRAVRRARAALR